MDTDKFSDDIIKPIHSQSLELLDFIEVMINRDPILVGKDYKEVLSYMRLKIRGYD